MIVWKDARLDILFWRRSGGVALGRVFLFSHTALLLYSTNTPHYISGCLFEFFQSPDHSLLNL